MFALLSPRLWIAAALAAALAFSHFYAYRSGKAHVQQEWTADKARANSEARALENRRQDRANEAVALAAARTNRIAADVRHARAESDGLRDERDAIRLHAAQSLAAATLTVAAYQDVFSQCVRRYSDVAEAADRATSDAVMLQQAWPRP